MQRLLRVLDHPQAADIIQKVINSRSVTAKDQTSARGDGASSSGGCAGCGSCPRCSTMIHVLSCTTMQDTTGPPSIAMDWTAHTLQQIVVMGSLTEGCALLSGLSSTAIYNLLVLLEQNIRILPKEALEQFVKNLEQLSCVCDDEWCVFLIQRLRRHFNNAHDQLLVDFKSIPTTTTRAHSATVVQNETANPVRNGNTEVERVRESVNDFVIPDSEDVPSPSDLRLPSPLPSEAGEDSVEEEESPSEEKMETEQILPEDSNMTKMARVYHEWALSKMADQEDFNCLCSLDNGKFLSCLKCFDGKCLPETAVTAISDNISSLPSELSYHNATSLLSSVILPMVVDLKQTAPRAMSSALCSINSLYPDAMVPALITPIFSSPSFGTHHGNLLLKVFQESSNPEQLANIWNGLAGIQVDSNGDAFYWNEDIASVALTLFQSGMQLGEDPATARTLVTTLQRNAAPLSRSSKFAKLVMEICKSPQYQVLISRFHSDLSEVVAQHQSILKSAMAREVRKLSALVDDE